MSRFDWKSTLAVVAPTIAGALGGPVAGFAVGEIAKALGVEPNEKAIAIAVSGGAPDVLEKLRRAESDFEVRLAELNIDWEQIHQSDRASARSLGKARGVFVQAILSGVLGFTFAWVLYSIFEGRVAIASDMRDIAIYALGTLNTLLVQVFNYWFGSSSGSKDKAATLDRAAR